MDDQILNLDREPDELDAKLPAGLLDVTAPAVPPEDDRSDLILTLPEEFFAVEAPERDAVAAIEPVHSDASEEDEFREDEWAPPLHVPLMVAEELGATDAEDASLPPVTLPEDFLGTPEQSGGPEIEPVVLEEEVVPEPAVISSWTPASGSVVVRKLDLSGFFAGELGEKRLRAAGMALAVALFGVAAAVWPEPYQGTLETGPTRPTTLTTLQMSPPSPLSLLRPAPTGPGDGSAPATDAPGGEPGNAVAPGPAPTLGAPGSAGPILAAAVLPGSRGPVPAGPSPAVALRSGGSAPAPSPARSPVPAPAPEQASSPPPTPAPEPELAEDSRRDRRSETTAATTTTPTTAAPPPSTTTPPFVETELLAPPPPTRPPTTPPPTTAPPTTAPPPATTVVPSPGPVLPRPCFDGDPPRPVPC